MRNIYRWIDKNLTDNGVNADTILLLIVFLSRIFLLVYTYLNIIKPSAETRDTYQLVLGVALVWWAMYGLESRYSDRPLSRHAKLMRKRSDQYRDFRESIRKIAASWKLSSDETRDEAFDTHDHNLHSWADCFEQCSDELYEILRATRSYVGIAKPVGKED